MELNRFIDFTHRMGEMLTQSGQAAFDGYVEAFELMLDGKQWYLLAYHDDPNNPGKRLVSDRMVNLTLEEASLGVQDMLQAVEDDKQQLN